MTTPENSRYFAKVTKRIFGGTYGANASFLLHVEVFRNDQTLIQADFNPREEHVIKEWADKQVIIDKLRNGQEQSYVIELDN